MTMTTMMNDDGDDNGGDDDENNDDGIEGLGCSGSTIVSANTA